MPVLISKLDMAQVENKNQGFQGKKWELEMGRNLDDVIESLAKDRQKNIEALAVIKIEDMIGRAILGVAIASR